MTPAPASPFDLSLVIPAQNEESRLPATLARISRLAQERALRIEVLIADDGSTDATIEVADELVVQYPQVRVVHHGDRQGRAAALKSGVERSEGDWYLARLPSGLGGWLPGAVLTEI